MSFTLSSLQSTWEKQQKPMFIYPDKQIFWQRFFCSLHALTTKLTKIRERNFFLYCDEPGLFALGLLALLSAGKNIHLPGIVAKPYNIGSSHPWLTDSRKESCMPLAFVENDLEHYEMLHLETPYFQEDWDNQKVIFHTSGSTGYPKEIDKTLPQIVREVQEIDALWGQCLPNATYCTTVSHQHFYGFLFIILWPLYRGKSTYAKRITNQEALIHLWQTCSLYIISSPAFLKRLVTSEIKYAEELVEPAQVFSSGGTLSKYTASAVEQWSGRSIIEIYGSTETGGIAWRVPLREESWQVFTCLAMHVDQSGQVHLTSPYLPKNSVHILEDEIEFLAGNRFILHGRCDSIVKIEEKRISLIEIENKLLQTELVADVVAIVLQEYRQMIAVAIEFNSYGLEKFYDMSKLEINKFFQSYLKDFFHPVLLPKKYRYLDMLPRNLQGKIIKDDLYSLFKNLIKTGKESHL